MREIRNTVGSVFLALALINIFVPGVLEHRHHQDDGLVTPIVAVGQDERSDPIDLLPERERRIFKILLLGVRSDVIDYEYWQGVGNSIWTIPTEGGTYYITPALSRTEPYWNGQPRIGIDTADKNYFEMTREDHELALDEIDRFFGLPTLGT